MSAARHQAYVEAPVDAVWALVGDPRRYPEWWPRMIEVRGERFEQGDEWVQVVRETRLMSMQSNFLVERREELRELRMSCQLTGTYAHWLLTPAQGGTFVEVQMGMEPTKLRWRAFDATTGERWFRRWSAESIDALRDAAARAASSAR